MQFVEQFGINKDTLKWHPAKPHVVPTEASQPQYPTGHIGQPSALSGFTASASQLQYPTGQPSTLTEFMASASQPQYPTGRTGQPSALSGFTASASQPQFPTGHTGQPSALSGFTASVNREKQYFSMLMKLSQELEKRNVSLDKLKFALQDFSGNRKLPDAKDALEIFRHIDDNVNVLIALFKLLRLNDLNAIFLEYGFSVENVEPGKIFSDYRISITSVGSNLNNRNISIIVNKFNVPDEKHTNQWKLLQYLQDEGELNEDNLMEFMEKCLINKDYLEWHPADQASEGEPLLQKAKSDVKVPETNRNKFSRLFNFLCEDSCQVKFLRIVFFVTFVVFLVLSIYHRNKGNTNWYEEPVTVISGFCTVYILLPKPTRTKIKQCLSKKKTEMNPHPNIQLLERNERSNTYRIEIPN